MKKLLIALIALTAAVCGMLAISGCADNKDEHRHALTFIAEKSATCTSDGNEAYYLCLRCGKCFEDEEGNSEITDRKSIVLPKGHKLTPVEGHKATCTDDGNSAYYVCSICNKWFNDRYGNSEITDKTSVVLPKKGHKLTPVEGHKATCTDDGNTVYYTCSGCDKWFKDENGKSVITDKSSVVLPKEGHRLTSVEGHNPTCTDDGNIAYYTCGSCDKWFEDRNGNIEIKDKTSVVLPKGHKLIFVNSKEATCTADGNISYYTCSGCDNWFKDEDGKIRISDKSSVVLPKGHKLSFVNAIEATCTNSGNIDFFVCDTCKKLFSDEDGKNEFTDRTSVFINKLPHDFEDKVCTECGYHEPTEGLSYHDYGGVCSANGIGTATDAEIYIADEYNGKPVNSIDRLAFNSYGCENIISVTIPYSVTTIFGGAFYACSSLSDIYYNGTRTQWDKIIKNSDWDNGLGEYTVHCTDVSTTYGHKLTLVRAEAATCTEDGHEAYYACAYCDRWFEDSDAKAEITDKSIVVLPKFGHDMNCFEEKGATCLEKGHTAYYICGNCDKWFFDEDGKTEIINKTAVIIKKLPHKYDGKVCTECGTQKSEPTAGLEYTDKGEYYELKGLGDATDGNIVIADEIDGKPVTSIAAGAFAWKALPTSIVIPDSVISIGDGAFQGCSNVTSITVSDNLTYIGKNVFYGCGMTNIVIPDGVTLIDEGAFGHCNNLVSIVIHDNVTSIGKKAFSWCRALQSVTIGSGVKNIGEYAFEMCEQLKSIVIPENVVSLGNNAFEDCTRLKSVTFSKNITSFGRNVLNNCSLIEDVYFDGTKAEWYRMTSGNLGSVKSWYTIHCTDEDILIIGSAI